MEGRNGTGKKDLIHKRGNPGEGPLLEALLSAVITLSGDAVDHAGSVKRVSIAILCY